MNHLLTKAPDRYQEVQSKQSKSEPVMVTEMLLPADHDDLSGLDNRVKRLTDDEDLMKLRSMEILAINWTGPTYQAGVSITN